MGREVRRVVADLEEARRLHVLQHSLGVDQYGRGQQYRDHFCAGPGHTDYETCCGLVADGLMTRRDCLPVVGGTMFYVTRAGRRWMAENSPAPPKLTRSQQRYRDWLAADWSSLTFGEWIKRGKPA